MSVDLPDCSKNESWEDYDVDSQEKCCQKMKTYQFQAIGCDLDDSDILDSEGLLTKSELLYNSLHEKNIYVPFTLKKTKLVDKTGWCQHKGWAQGTNESDCFLDSTFFSMFGNDKISVLLSNELDSLYYESVESNIKKIVYCISVYTELLARSRPKNNPKLITKNITIVFEGEEEIYDFKQTIKWCLLWYLCLHIKDTYGPDSYEYNYIVLNGLSSSIKPNDLDFDGGDPIKLLTGLSFIFDTIFINWKDDEFGKLYETKTASNDETKTSSNDETKTASNDETKTASNDIINMISTTLDKYSNNDIIVIPFFGPINIVRPYTKFFMPKNGLLEANIFGTQRHVTSTTHCNTYWLVYDNMNKSNTTITHIDGNIIKLKILDKNGRRLF